MYSISTVRSWLRVMCSHGRPRAEVITRAVQDQGPEVRSLGEVFARFCDARPSRPRYGDWSTVLVGAMRDRMVLLGLSFPMSTLAVSACEGARELEAAFVGGDLYVWSCLDGDSLTSVSA